MSCSERVRVECWPPRSVRWRLQCASVCDIRQILPAASPCYHGPGWRSQFERVRNSFTRGRSFVDRLLQVLRRDPMRYPVRLASVGDERDDRVQFKCWFCGRREYVCCLSLWAYVDFGGISGTKGLCATTLTRWCRGFRQQVSAGCVLEQLISRGGRDSHDAESAGCERSPVFVRGCWKRPALH